MSYSCGRNFGAVLKSENNLSEQQCSYCRDKLSCSKCPHLADYFKKEIENFYLKVEALKKKHNVETRNERSTPTKI